MKTDIQTHTEPTSLESGMDIECHLGDWTITVGGGQQPRWKVKAGCLEDAIGQLVYQVTESAIEDEAREWKEHGEP